jgi:hypothetical protein
MAENVRGGSVFREYHTATTRQASFVTDYLQCLRAEIQLKDGQKLSGPQTYNTYRLNVKYVKKWSKGIKNRVFFIKPETACLR